MDLDFRHAYCAWREIPVERFEHHVLIHCLTRRARLIRPVVGLVHPDAFHPEKALIRDAGEKSRMEDIRFDIDFYQHKHVVNSLRRDALRFRASGIRLQRLAAGAFRHARTNTPIDGRAGS